MNMSLPGQLTCAGSGRWPAARFRQDGLTLVELMVAMALGMLLVIALAALLINVNRNSSELSKDNAIIENGRFALQLLQADLSHAGYWGGYVPQFDDLTRDTAPLDVPSTLVDPSLPNPCLALASWDADYQTKMVTIPVQVYPVGSAMPCSAKIVSPQPNTDVLFVRHAAPCVASATAPEYECKDIANDLYFQVQRCTVDTAPSFVNQPYVLGTTGLLLRKRDCSTTSAGTLADRHKFVSNIYYVRSYSLTAGDGIPTLMRIPFRCTLNSAGTACDSPPEFKSAEALIEGVERFRVELGLDTVSDSGNNILTAAAPADRQTAVIKWANPDVRNSATNRGDGNPDGQYVHCNPCTSDQLINAVAVRLYVLVRSPLRTAGYTDPKTYAIGSAADAYTYAPGGAFKRHLFLQTVRLTNISMRRETP